MSMIESLTEIRDNLTYSLRYCNEALLEKGGEAAETLHVVGEKIAALPSGGDDELAKIALQAPTDDELGTAEVKLDSSWGNLKEQAFYANTKLKSVDLSECENMTKIPAVCFNSCTNLENIIFPETLTTVDEKSFRNCTALTSVDLPDSITSISYQAFSDCSKLASAHLPGGLRTIPDKLFYQCALTSIDLPQMVGSIGDSAFYGNKLTTVTVPSVVRTIKNAAFGYNTTLKTVYFTGTPVSLNSGVFQSSRNISDIYVPWSKGEVANAPWGATNAAIHYDWTEFKHISIKIPPNKTVYRQGEIFDPTGMQIYYYDEEAVYEIGHHEIEYSTEPLEVGDPLTFYIYFTHPDTGERFITYIDLTVSQI